MSLVRRIQLRLERAKRSVVGRRIRGVAPVGHRTAHEFAGRYTGVSAKVLVENDGLSQVSPKALPDDSSRTIQPFLVQSEAVILDIENRGFFFDNHVLVSPDWTIVAAEALDPWSVMFTREFATRRPRHLNGTVAYLSNTWIDNYYHWMQLTLPLLRFYRALEPAVEIDHYYIGPSFHASIQEETLALAGIGREKIVRDACTADRMICAVTSHPEQHEGMRYRDRWSHGFVRDLVPRTVHADVPRRVFVRRGSVSSRRLVNEDEVGAILERLGFVSVSPAGLTVLRQAELFANAEVIVGVHGAALTNLIFASDATVIEILPADRQEPGMFVAATYSRLNYHYVLAEVVSRRDDLHLDIDKLRRILAMAAIQ